MSVSAVIPSAGAGKRMGQPKSFIEVLGKPLIYYTIIPFEKSEYIEEIILVAGRDELNEARKLAEKYKFKKIKAVIEGGIKRQDSVNNGLKAVSEGCEYILVHDGARPLVSVDIIAGAVSEVKKYHSVAVGVPSKDTVKEITDDGMVKDTLDRNIIWLIQTPQIFSRDIILEAYKRAVKIGYKATDDAKLVERMGQEVRLVKGSYENIKVTAPEDLAFVEAILKKRG